MDASGCSSIKRYSGSPVKVGNSCRVAAACAPNLTEKQNIGKRYAVHSAFQKLPLGPHIRLIEKKKKKALQIHKVTSGIVAPFCSLLHIVASQLRPASYDHCAQQLVQTSTKGCQHPALAFEGHPAMATELVVQNEDIPLLPLQEFKVGPVCLLDANHV